MADSVIDQKRASKPTDCGIGGLATDDWYLVVGNLANKPVPYAVLEPKHGCRCLLIDDNDEPSDIQQRVDD